jgi:hypothetical protein
MRLIVMTHAPPLPFANPRIPSPEIRMIELVADLLRRYIRRASAFKAGVGIAGRRGGDRNAGRTFGVHGAAHGASGIASGATAVSAGFPSILRSCLIRK